MRTTVLIIAALAIGFAWLTMWSYFLGVPLTWFQRNAQDRIMQRERLIRIGQMKYILTAGLLGKGVAYGVVMGIVDLAIDSSSHGLRHEMVKLAFMSVFFGLITGALGWDTAVRGGDKGPPPFPPIK